MVMQAQGKLAAIADPLDVYICAMGEKASQLSMSWLFRLRNQGFKVDRDYLGRSVKAQLRDAHRQNTKIVLFIGDNEIENKTFSLKDMESGIQSDIGFDDIEKYLKKNLKS
jgi:histidyl-tRNA synthetase